jgi:hypothetical protein
MLTVALLFASLISSGTAAPSHPKKLTSTLRLARSMACLFSDAVLASSVTTSIRNVCVRLCIAIPPMIFSSTWQISPNPGFWPVHSRFGTNLPFVLFFNSNVGCCGRYKQRSSRNTSSQFQALHFLFTAVRLRLLC